MFCISNSLSNSTLLRSNSFILYYFINFLFSLFLFLLSIFIFYQNGSSHRMIILRNITSSPPISRSPPHPLPLSLPLLGAEHISEYDRTYDQGQGQGHLYVQKQRHVRTGSRPSVSLDRGTLDFDSQVCILYCSSYVLLSFYLT